MHSLNYFEGGNHSEHLNKMSLGISLRKEFRVQILDFLQMIFENEKF